MSRHPSFESRILEYFETIDLTTGAVVLGIIHEVAKKRGFAPKRGASAKQSLQPDKLSTAQQVGYETI